MESTQSKYRRVPKSTEQPEINENEVRITTAGKVKKYVDYALGLFGEVAPRKTSSEDEDAEPPKIFETIVLKATGRAINHAVTTAEVVKRRVVGIHQVTQLDTLEIEDEWEPLEEGLLPVKTSRRVASVTITLSKDGTQVDSKSPGYQPPLVLGPLSGEYFTQAQLGLRRSPPSSRGSSGANQSGGRRRRGRGGDAPNRGGDRGNSGGGASDRGSDRGSERSGGRRRGGSGGRRTPDSGPRSDMRRDDRRGGGGGSRRDDRRDERDPRDRRDGGGRRRRRGGPRDQRDGR